MAQAPPVVAHQAREQALGCKPFKCCRTLSPDPLREGLSLIAVVVGGLMFAFGEGGSKKALAGIIFGLGMAMGAANFLSWLF